MRPAVAVIRPSVFRRWNHASLSSGQFALVEYEFVDVDGSVLDRSANWPFGDCWLSPRPAGVAVYGAA